MSPDLLEGADVLLDQPRRLFVKKPKPQRRAIDLITAWQVPGDSWWMMPPLRLAVDRELVLLWIRRTTSPHAFCLQCLTESRIIPRQSKQREDCFQKAVIRRGLRLMRRSALRARSFSSP